MAPPRDLVDDAGVYTTCTLKRRVKLPARLQNKHAHDSIMDILKATVEGVCGADGFVRPNSINIVSISPGKLELASLSGSAVYDVRFIADLCNPARGDVLTCRVENVNTYGVLAVNMSETRVLEVILPRNPVSFEHAVSLDGIEPGDILCLEILDRQFKLGQRTITLVGRAVSSDGVPSTAPAKGDVDDADLDGTDEDADDDLDDDDLDDDLDDPDDPDDPEDPDEDPVEKGAESDSDDEVAVDDPAEEASVHDEDDDLDDDEDVDRDSDVL